MSGEVQTILLLPSVDNGTPKNICSTVRKKMAAVHFTTDNKTRLLNNRVKLWLCLGYSHLNKCVYLKIE